MKRNNIRIAIQKEGRLKESSIEFLKSIGLQFSKEMERIFIIPCKNAAVEILFVRHSDIPQYVQSGTADFGIVGENILLEKNFKGKKIKKLNFGNCNLVIATPINSPIKKVEQLEGERIATSYLNTLRQFLQKKKINAAIIEIRGAVEITPSLGLADAICDLTQTGKTLKENNLKPIETLFSSSAMLIESPFESKQKKEFINKFLAKVL